MYIILALVHNTPFNRQKYIKEMKPTTKLTKNYKPPKIETRVCK